MQRNPVESSMFKSVGYDSATETLEVEFKNAKVYQYSPFTAEDWRKFRTAKSKGSHFSQFIRNDPKVATKFVSPEPKP